MVVQREFPVFIFILQCLPLTRITKGYRYGVILNQVNQIFLFASCIAHSPQ